MVSPEEQAFDRKVTIQDSRTFTDHARNLAEFLDVVYDGTWRVDLAHTNRYTPLSFDRSLFAAEVRSLIGEVRNAYRDPEVFIASDQLRRFFDLAIKKNLDLPSVTPAAPNLVSWFKPRQRGHWSSTSNIAPYPVPVVGHAAVRDRVDPRILSDIPPHHRRLYRDIVRMLRVFDVNHRLTRAAVKNLIRELEYENGRVHTSTAAAAGLIAPPLFSGQKSLTPCQRSARR